MTAFSPDGQAALITGANTGIGPMAVFLTAPAPDYVNGAVLNVDGGWLAR
ncbi:hypothetical protein [Paracoccus methylarcula]|nr:hypothetical protein [Paracoccus methylarcula]